MKVCHDKKFHVAIGFDARATECVATTHNCSHNSTQYAATERTYARDSMQCPRNSVQCERDRAQCVRTVHTINLE